MMNISDVPKTNPCLVCEYLTVDERSAYDICPVCYWEDDGMDEDPDEVLGGPNGDLSLTDAKNNFTSIGAVEYGLLKYVRPPMAAEWIEGLASPEVIEERQKKARQEYHS